MLVKRKTMRNIFVILAIVMGLFCVTVNQAHALIILDTGQPPDDTFGWYLHYGQSLACEFTISGDTPITDIHGWIYSYAGTTGPLTIAIYGDGGNIPDKYNQIFARTGSLPSSGGPDWYGFSGLHWDLSPGSYWVSFEVREAAIYLGEMPYPAPHPASHYAYNNTGNWVNYDNLRFGARIISEDIVPEPSTLLLFGSALLGAGFFRRKKAGR